MGTVDRWLLPDGIEEMLPAEAQQTEQLRRSIINLFQRWGYDYVIPPMVEFTDSLLTGSGQDIDLLTFKVTDQLSGKMMGIRADITPQVARIDAHSLQREGINRLSYAGHVMHTRPSAPLSSRTPIQAGVELFGEPGLEADIEVVSLLLETLKAAAHLPKQYIDFGHVGIYRTLSRAANLSEEQEHNFFNLLQTKSVGAIQTWLDAQLSNDKAKAWLSSLSQLSGGIKILAEAKEAFSEAPVEVGVAIDELETLANAITGRYPEAQLYFDLSELRGYHYHTGIVFGAFTPGVGTAVAKGGRYDHIGESFGRARPATGFDVDLSEISRIVPNSVETTWGIYALASDDPAQWIAIQSLRASGERVICGLSGQAAPHDYQCCDRKLVASGGKYIVETISA